MNSTEIFRLLVLQIEMLCRAPADVLIASPLMAAEFFSGTKIASILVKSFTSSPNFLASIHFISTLQLILYPA